MPLASYPHLSAGGNILPSRFVKWSAANTVVQAGANERTLGVSQIGAKDPPGVKGSGTYAAESGDSLLVHQAGEYAKVELGGNVAAGKLLKSDSVGRVVEALTTGAIMQWVAAESVQAGVAGDIVYVKLLPPTPYYPALS